MLRFGLARAMTAVVNSPADQTMLLPLHPMARRRAVLKNKRDWVGIGVVGAAIALSVAACVYFYASHRALAYHDAYSHLEISRRVLVSRTTGIAQLGAIWLPLPHVLESVFAWNYKLYVTGLAGALVSMTAFVVATSLIYRIVRELSASRRWPAVVAAAVFMTNANMLYHQTTAMDELPFYAFELAVVYGLVRWASSRRPGYLLQAAIASMLAMLCRYEGWFAAGVFVVTVFIMAWRMGYSWRDARGLTATFLTFGALIASTGWLVYNWIITGSPLNFLTGENSSADQMVKHQGDAEYHSWSNTVRAFWGAMVADHGLLVLGLAAAGLYIFMISERFSARSLPILALGSIIPFYIVTIESGQEPIGIPPVNPTLLNLRFALVALLPAAVLIGYLVAKFPKWFGVTVSVLTLIALTGVSASAFRHDQIVTAREAQEAYADQALQAEVGDFLIRHPEGPILINLVGNERVAFPVLDRVVYEGTKIGHDNIWAAALRDPSIAEAEFVVMRHSLVRGDDDVYTALHDKPAMAVYHVVFRNADYTIYQLKR